MSLREDIAKCASPCFLTLDEKICALRNQLRTRPRCICGEYGAFRRTHFSNFCSVKCAAQAETRNEKIKKTNEERYGGHWMSNAKNKLAFVQQCKENGSYEKMQYTFSERYGAKNVFALSKTKLKIQDTMMRRYGVKNPQQLSNIREQTKDTLIRKYGVPYPAQSAVIFEKMQRSLNAARYKIKTGVLPSGKEIQYQGYELHVVLRLIEIGIPEEDILIQSAEIPTITYFSSGREHRYFPDIFIPSKHLLIEVKSVYTWQCDMEKNLAKHEASINSGFAHWIVVWDIKKNMPFAII